MQARDSLVAEFKRLRQGAGLTLGKLEQGSPLLSVPVVETMVGENDSTSRRALAVVALIHEYLRTRVESERPMRAAASALNLDVSEPWQGRIRPLSTTAKLMARRKALVEAEDLTFNNGYPADDWENDEGFPRLAQHLLDLKAPPIATDGSEWAPVELAHTPQLASPNLRYVGSIAAGVLVMLVLGGLLLALRGGDESGLVEPPSDSDAAAEAGGTSGPGDSSQPESAEDEQSAVAAVVVAPSPSPEVASTPSATPEPAPTATPQPTVTPLPTLVPTPTEEPTPVPTVTPEPTPLPTSTPVPTATPWPVPTPSRYTSCGAYVFEPSPPGRAFIDSRLEDGCPVWRSELNGIGASETWSLDLLEGQAIRIFYVGRGAPDFTFELNDPQGELLHRDTGVDFQGGGWNSIPFVAQLEGRYTVRITAEMDRETLYMLRFVDETVPF